MGKLLPSSTNICQFANRICSPNQSINPKFANTFSSFRSKSPTVPATSKHQMAATASVVGVDPRSKMMNNSDEPQPQNKRIPLAKVVAGCTRRWFQDTLKEAKSGDIAMQVLVARMYCNGYGVPRNAQKGRDWIIRASNCNVFDEPGPGYNTSDSDSNDPKADA